MACYSSNNCVFLRHTSHLQRIKGAQRWRLAGYCVSWLFVHGGVGFCLVAKPDGCSTALMVDSPSLLPSLSLLVSTSLPPQPAAVFHFDVTNLCLDSLHYTTATLHKLRMHNKQATTQNHQTETILFLVATEHLPARRFNLHLLS